MRYLFLVGFFLCRSLASGQARQVQYQGDLAPLNSTPSFDHGYLIAYDRNNQIDVYSADGFLMYRAAVQVPDSKPPGILNADADSDGTVAVASRFGDAKSHAVHRLGGFALFDRAGNQIGFFDTGDYLPTQVAFGPDHSVWTIGELAGGVDSFTADYFVLRNYSREGKELGRFLSRATFAYLQLGTGIPIQPLVMPMLGLWELRVSKNHVDAIFHQGHVWAQTDLKGQEQGRWSLVEKVRPRAITADGRAWAQRKHGLQVFDRKTGTWSAVTLAAAGTLLGADGDLLVFLEPSLGTLRWVPEPAGS
jgi:hypothetical protein